MSRPWQEVIGEKFSPADFDSYCHHLKAAAWRPQFVVIHNSGDPTFADWHTVSGAARMRGLTSYYRDDKHWSAGPHLFVADDGIWIFTPVSTPGVHSPSWNAISWGMEIVGDYDHEVLRDDVKHNAISALTTLHRISGWIEPHLKLHKDDPKTDHKHCPGVNVNRVEFETKVQFMLTLDVPIT
jgi:hypothetical protein